MATRKRKTAARTGKPKARKAGPARKAKAARPAPRAAGRRRRRRSNPETLRLRAVIPNFTVNDLSRSLAFYKEVLGFIETEQWKDGGVLRGVMLKAGACELGLSQDDWAKGRDRRKGEGVRLWCQTAQDVDALAARVKAAGVRLTEEPQDRWGSRSFSLDDPDGYHLSISRTP
jgi:lactoylglutathione lyase